MKRYARSTLCAKILAAVEALDDVHLLYVVGEEIIGTKFVYK